MGLWAHMLIQQGTSGAQVHLSQAPDQLLSALGDRCTNVGFDAGEGLRRLVQQGPCPRCRHCVEPFLLDVSCHRHCRSRCRQLVWSLHMLWTGSAADDDSTASSAVSTKHVYQYWLQSHWIQQPLLMGNDVWEFK